MSMPEIPDKEQEESLTDLLESIALEETALAHFTNAEAEKMQVIAEKLKAGEVDHKEVMDFQKSVSKVLRNSMKKQMLLQFKLEEVLEAKKDLE